MIVIVLTGAPASGKSTVAERLASCLDRAAHIQVDFFRKMVKGGYASPHHWNDEVDRQYRIARTRAAQTARNLAVAGFLPILDDIVPPAWVDEWRRELDGLDCRFVVLCPRLDVAQRRNRERPIWSVDETLFAELHAMLEGPHEGLARCRQLGGDGGRCGGGRGPRARARHSPVLRRILRRSSARRSQGQRSRMVRRADHGPVES